MARFYFSSRITASDSTFTGATKTAVATGTSSFTIIATWTAAIKASSIAVAGHPSFTSFVKIPCWTNPIIVY